MLRLVLINAICGGVLGACFTEERFWVGLVSMLLLVANSMIRADLDNEIGIERRKP